MKKKSSLEKFYLTEKAFFIKNRKECLMKLCKICYQHEHKTKSLKWSKIIFNHLHVFILFMGFSRQEY